MRIKTGFVVAAVTAVMAALSLGVQADEPLTNTQRVSLSSSGGLPNGASIYAPSVSNEGRYVAFTSQASNIVPGDTNNQEDAFVYDRLTGETEMVSVNTLGVQGNDDSVFPVISSDGRYVAFHSIATNLAPGDVNGAIADVFLRDRLTDTTRLVSARSDGASGNGHSVDPNISLDGRFIAYFSGAGDIAPGDTNAGIFDVMVYDVIFGTTSRISVGAELPIFGLIFGTTVANGDNFAPAISADGRFVAFHSGASNLVPGDTNGSSDIFVHDRVLVQTKRVSTGLGETQADASSAYAVISADGNTVAFSSAASNLVGGDNNGKLDVFVKEINTGAIWRVTANGFEGNGDTQNPAMTADGRLVAVHSTASNFVGGDTNGVSDIFVWDRATGGITRQSVNSSESQANGASVNPALSPDGRLLGFISGATNLKTPDNNGFDDVYLRNIIGEVEDMTPPTVGPLPPVPGAPECVPFDPFNTTLGQLINCAVDYVDDQA